MKLRNALSHGILLCDGAMGTELIRHGLLSDGQDRVLNSASSNIERPDKVQAIHEEYIRAGAQVILTNTFEANRLKLEPCTGYSVQKLNRTGVEIARRASAGTNVLVFGNIGPTGYEQQLFYALDSGGSSADKTKQDFYDLFKEQAVALAEAEVDAILIETMMYLQEAVLAVKAASENTRIPVICTMAFGTPAKSRPTDFRTFAWGDTLTDVINGLIEAGAMGLGANCGDIIEAMPQLAQQMRKMTSLPLVFQVNAGRAELDVETSQTVHHLTPAEFGQIILELAAMGANVVGGCCGTVHEHIAEASRRLKQAMRRSRGDSSRDV